LTWYYGILRSKTKRQGTEKLHNVGHVAKGKDYIVAQAGFCVLVLLCSSLQLRISDLSL
jgi:hypothetical protein